MRKYDFKEKTPRILANFYNSTNPAQFFFTIFLLLHFNLMFQLFTFFRYFSIDVGAWWLVSPVEDGWCDKSQGQGIGGHCFGDYSLTATVAAESNPWTNSIFGYFNYFAGGLLPFRFLTGVETISGIQNLGLLVFLTLIVTSLVLPAFFLDTETPLRTKILLAAGSLATLPSLLVFDRGNSTSLAFIFAFVFVYYFQKGKLGIALLLITVSALIKPQFAVFILLFFFHRKWKHLFLGFISVLGSQLISFLFWPEAFPGSIFEALGGVSSYGNNFDFSSQYPPNYSIANGLAKLLSLFGFQAVDHIQIFVLVVIVVCTVLIYVLHERVSNLSQIIFLGTIASFGVSLSWGYYSIIAILFVFLLISGSAGISRSSCLALYLIAIGSALTLSRLIVTLPTPSGVTTIDNTASIGLMWLVISITVVVLDSHRNKQRIEV